MPDDPGEAQAELDRCDRRPERSVHPSGRPCLHSFGQWAGIHRPGSPRLDRSRRGEDGLYRTRLTLGEWLLRELQRPIPRRASERRDLLQPPRSANHHRNMEEALQHQTPAQCIGLSPTGTRSHHPDGPKASHALTFKLDHQTGADQGLARQILAHRHLSLCRPFNYALGTHLRVGRSEFPLRPALLLRDPRKCCAWHRMAALEIAAMRRGAVANGGNGPSLPQYGFVHVPFRWTEMSARPSEVRTSKTVLPKNSVPCDTQPCYIGHIDTRSAANCSKSALLWSNDTKDFWWSRGDSTKSRPNRMKSLLDRWLV